MIGYIQHYIYLPSEPRVGPTEIRDPRRSGLDISVIYTIAGPVPIAVMMKHLMLYKVVLNVILTTSKAGQNSAKQYPIHIICHCY